LTEKIYLQVSYAEGLFGKDSKLIPFHQNRLYYSMITDFLKHRLQKLRLKNESYDIPHKIQTEWITNSNFGLTDNEIKEFDQIFDRMKIHEFTFNELQ